MGNPRDNQPGFIVIERLLVLLFVGIIGFTGWYVLNANKKTNATYSAATQDGGGTPKFKDNSKKTSSTIPTVTSENPSVTTSNIAQPEQKQPTQTFNFIDTTGWQPRSPTDKSFNVAFDTLQTYGSCADATGILMIGMVFLNTTGAYDCTGIKDSLTPKPPRVVLTYVAIGPSESLWDKGDSTSAQVTLAGGQQATRYDYTTNISGTIYDTIEYDVTNQAKTYVAVMHWPSSINFNSGSYIYPDYFDTIVQKTWTFN